jgi:hypothetical protein
MTYPHVRQLDTFDPVLADHLANARRRRARMGVGRRWGRRWRAAARSAGPWRHRGPVVMSRRPGPGGT